MTLQQYLDSIHRRFMLGKVTKAQGMPEFNPELVKQISQGLGLIYVPEKEAEGNVCMANADEVRPEYRQVFAPIDLLDYIYAVLHSPAYREKYKEFLKIDFPRLPYPKDTAVFWKLVELGGQIRQIHLLDSPLLNRPITHYPIDGDNGVSKLRFVAGVTAGMEDEASSPSEMGRVYINDSQYFDRVPALAWTFYIGGYQPAQKWLKDRKGGKLEFEDILHYQKIIVALTETDRLMKEIDQVGVED